MSKIFDADSLYFDELAAGVSAGLTFDDGVSHFDSTANRIIPAVLTFTIPTEQYITVENLSINILLDFTIDENYAKYIDLLPLIPEKFRDSVALHEFLDEAGLQVGSWIGSIDDLVGALDPYIVGVDFLQNLADLIGLTISGGDEALENTKRRQLIQAIALYKIKGTYQSIQYIAYLLGMTLNIWDEYTKDYSTFIDEPWFVGKLTNSGTNGNDQYTKLLLHGQTLTDSSDLPATVTNHGVAVSTTTSVLGDSSLYFNGSSYLALPSDNLSTNGSFETWTGLTDILINGAMETWTNPTTLTNWTTLSGTLGQDSTTTHGGTYSARLTGAGAAAISQGFSGVSYRNKTIVLSSWVWCNGANTAKIGFNDGFSSFVSSYHSGVPGWEFLTAIGLISGSCTTIGVTFEAGGNVAVASNFDSAKCYEMLPPTGWILAGTGATVSREEGIINGGTYSAKLTRNGANCYIYQDIQNAGGHNLAYWKGRTVTASVKCYATVASRVRIAMRSVAGVDEAYSSYHTGVAGWQTLTLTFTVSSSATDLILFAQVITGDTTAYFDDVTLLDGNTTRYQVGSNDFVIDFRAYFTDITTVSNRVVIGQWGPTTCSYVFYWNQSSNLLVFAYTIDGSTIVYKSVSWGPTLNTWYHLSVARKGDNLYFRVNGVQIGSVQSVAGVTITPFVLPLGIGATLSPSSQFIGYLEEVRLSIGTSRGWETVFTPQFDPYSGKPKYIADNPSTLDSTYYKSPHIGIELLLNTVYGTSGDYYLFAGTELDPIEPYVEGIRPVNVVVNYRIFLNPVTNESGTVVTMPGDINTCVVGNWNIGVLNFDQTPVGNFDNGKFFDYSDTAFLHSIIKYKLGTGNKGVLPYTSGFALQTIAISGNITSITEYDEYVDYLIMVPSATVQAGISELGLYLTNNTTLTIASTFPDINKVSGIILRILVRLYKAKS